MNDPFRSLLDGTPSLSGGRTFDAYYFGPLAVVYFALLLAVVFFKPEAIRRRWLFRISVVFFSLFLLLPCVGEIEALFGGPPMSNERRWVWTTEIRARTRPVGDFLAMVCLVLAILTGIGSAGRPPK